MDEEYNETSELYRALKRESQERRASHRKNSAYLLDRNNIPYTAHNGGAHLIVKASECFVDFWPGTGRWKSRNGETGFGVKNLIKFINGEFIK